MKPEPVESPRRAPGAIADAAAKTAAATAEGTGDRGPPGEIEASSFEGAETSKFLLGHSRDIVLVLNKRGQIIFANKSALAGFGYSKEELLGKSIIRFLTKDSIKEAFFALAQEFLGRPQPELELKVKTKSGEIRYISVAESSASVYKNGKQLGIMITASDITDRLRAVTELQGSKERFKDLWENAPVAYHTADTNGVITDANQTEARMLGYRKEELIGKSVFELMPPEQRTDARERFHKKIAGRSLPRSADRIFVGKDGAKIHVAVNDSLERAANGRIIGLRSTLVDITKLKESEEALRSSEEHFRDLVEKSGIAILVDDREGNIVYFNRRFADIFGYSPEEMKERTIWTCVHPDDAEKLKSYHRARVRGDHPPSRYELRGIRKDGSTVFLEVDVVVVEENGRLIGTRSYAWDITDRKGAEVRQRESDERLRSIVEHAHDGILILDEAFHIIYANPESASISGYALEEIMGRDFRLFLDSESKNSVSGFYVRLLKRERVPPRHEFNIIRKDGQKRQVEVSSSVVPGAGGKLEIVAQIHDITAHQRALEELKTSEEKFKILFDYAPDAYYLNDAKGRLVDANKRAETMLGYKKEELIGKSLLVDQILAGGQIPKAASLMARNLLGHATGPEEFMVRRKDGSTISVEIQNYPVRMKDTTLILGIARDITERRQAEKAIRESEEKYRGVVERSNDGITIIQDGIIRYANPRLAQMWGGAPEELTGTPFHVHVHPDEARRMVDVYERRMTGEKIPAIRETVLLRKDGTKIYAELSGGLVDYQGKPANLVMVRDITERRRMEEELRRIAWMLCPGERAVSSTPDPEERVKPSHADLVALNTSRVILDAVGTETLENIVRDYVDLLDTSVAVYEANGDHAYAISSSAWCRFMRQASRRLCGTEDTREALASGKWLCHESCWRHTSKVSIETGAPVDVECTGGIRCYALPIRAGDEIVGAIKIGYGDPPRDESKLLQLAAAYAVNAKELAERASAYESRPLYVAKMAKRRLEASARLIGEIVERRRAESELKATLQNLRAIIRATVQAIATAVEVRDPYTAGHQKRVADLARAIAKEMGLPQDKIEGLRTAGVIHDLGKLSIPAEILSKPTKLTNIEFSLIQTHSEMGYEILKDISFPWPVARIVREHHERMDGSGYPQGLKGDEILIESRILAVADVVEAIASHRPYRPSKGIEAAIEEIQGRKGQAYDPDVVDACLRVFNNGYQFPALDRAQERVNPASQPGPPAIK